MFTHVVPHVVRGAPHVGWQWPPTQNDPEAHIVLQLPQNIGSVSVFTQLPPQSVPAAQRHIPP